MKKTTSHLQQPREAFPVQTIGCVIDDANMELTAPISGYPNSASAGNSLTSKLSKLSTKERAHGINELHGVAATEGEVPEMMQANLEEMTKIADSFDDKQKTAAYRKALEMNEQYVNGIKLLCLRADYYDPEKAAARLASFFAFKQRLFGDEMLARDIVLDDFNEEDRTTLENGLCQVPQQTDQMGRAIVLVRGKVCADSKLETVVRLLDAISYLCFNENLPNTRLLLVPSLGFDYYMLCVHS
jgi:hypothetical protein